jgi:two-component system cell cycle sensor histidine kinase/response regulator CckA
LRSGVEALEHYQTSWSNVSLVILDMVMPQVNGKELFLAMREINPDVKAILASGGYDNDKVEDVISIAFLKFLQKPFSVRELSEALEELL